MLLGAAGALLLTEKTAQTEATERADEAHLARTAGCALGLVTLEHLTDKRRALHRQNAHARLARLVCWALHTHVAALLTRELGTNGGGDAHKILDVLGGALGATWALVVLGLGIVHSLATCSLGVVFAGRRVVNNATFRVQEAGW